jgi:hypothetical protein
MGAAISEHMAQTIATQQLTFGWNADQTNQALAKFVNLNASGAFGGTAGQNSMVLNQLAVKNGVSVDDATMKNFMRDIAGNRSSVEDMAGFIRKQAAGKYPAYGEQIMAGTNLSDIAAPYQQTMQNLLEVGPGDTQITNPHISSALQHTDEKGQPIQMPLSQFATQLRQQPAWKSTQNAQDSIMAAGHEVIKAMGLGE